KKLIAFDLDGTVTESKSPMDAEMADIFGKILSRMKIAIISGGAYEQFERQLPALQCSVEQLQNLFFFPTPGTRFYRYTDKWEQIYADEMTVEERQKIKESFEKAFIDIGYEHPAQLYGEVVEDRGTQVTFSACGQQAPLEVKKAWKETQDRRPEIAKAVEKDLPAFEVKIPGVTSIDVTRKGIDKAYGIHKIEELLHVTVPEMVFVGDALYEGGNDHAVIRTGVETVAVANPTETKAVLRQWLTEMGA
ncbi:MAG: HAD-IIB family hydrolase, partial [Patescibacteria group bacterium]